MRIKILAEAEKDLEDGLINQRTSWNADDNFRR